MTKLKIKKDWDLTPLLDSDDDPRIEKILKTLESEYYEFINKWKARDDYLTDATVLREALDDLENLSANFGEGGKVGYYFWLRAQLDSENTEIKAMNAKLYDIEVKIDNDMLFFELNLAKISPAKQKLFLNSDELLPYKHYLEVIFRDAKYLLSEKEEKILSLMAKSASGDWVKMVSDFLSRAELAVLDSTGKKVKKTLSESLTLASQDKNVKVRATASAAIKKLLEGTADVAERELNAILYSKKTSDELRGLETPNLARLLSDDIEPDIVTAMAAVVTENFNLSRDYYEFKAKLLGMKQLEYYDKGLKYGAVDAEYTFEEAIALTEQVFSEIDPEFGEYVRTYAAEGHIDALPRKGKTGSIKCIACMKSLPVYILHNHTNKLGDVKTIAHEMGHALNDEYMFKAQNALNADTPLSTAEVASTFFEGFIQDKLLESLSGEARLSLLLESIDDEISTILRQTACYNFEGDLHKEYREKGFLSKEDLGKIFIKNMKSYMGPSVNQKQLGHVGWVYWSHIRRFFYVYSYSNGLLVSKALQKKYKDNPAFIEDFKRFLSAGASQSPKDIFLNMGIDISKKSFWREGLVDLSNKISQAKALAKELGKI
jgi:oligoendopeptidase F